MPGSKNTSLVVGVESILYKPDPDVEANTFSFTADSQGFYATIDSTLPYLWLPDDICDKFEERFQLEYDEDSNFYTVNASAHQHNKQQNATLSFKIGATDRDSNDFATIILPYDAFDLQLNWPLVDNETQYFPIKKSPNGNFVLGRAFLQESYIVVDYERSNFTVAPAYYSEPMPDQNLVSIYNKTYKPPVISPTPIPSGGDGLSPGAVAGIVVGIVVVFLLAGLGAFFWWKKSRKGKKQPYMDKTSDIDTVVAGSEISRRRISELDSQPPGSPKLSTLGGYYGDREQKDVIPFPPISEMESPPVQSPPAAFSTPYSEGNSSDYFVQGNKMGRHSASGNNTPGLIAELPGDDGTLQIGSGNLEPMAGFQPSPTHNQGPADGSRQTNIDEVMTRPDPSRERKPEAQSDIKEEHGEAQPKGDSEAGQEGPLERRPAHTRGLSDTTMQSDSTAVSQPTPEDLEQWANDDGPRRPLSE